MKIKIQAGIYQIKCLINNKIYIGSSINLKERMMGHISRLRSSKHKNKYLQSSWNQYGENNFEFSIIEIIENSNILQIREQHWIDTYQSFKREIGFNLAHLVENTSYENHPNAKEWIVTTPNGKEINVKNLEKYCRENGLNRGAMGEVARGNVNQHKKYTCRFPNQTKEEWKKTIKRSKKFGPGWKGDWEIIYPDKSKKIVTSLTQFCKDNNLSQGNMTEVANGKRKHHKGFKCSRYLP